MPGTHDCGVECLARPDRVVRSAFRAQVRHEHRIADVVRCLDIGSDRGDHHIAPHTRGLGRVGEQNGGVTVDRLLARRSAARSRTGGEHHRVGILQVRRNIGGGGRFEVDDHRLGAGRLQVGGVVGVPDQPDCRVSALGEQPFQDEGDLPCPPAMTTRMSPCYGRRQRAR